MFDLRVTGSDKIDPNPGGIITAFARIGYKLTEAVADIVDNAVDAKATNILIRFFCSEDAIRRVAFVDDGDGMSDATLSKAMQFGTSTKHPESQLGKYGIGMKSASFSQCRHLSVVTVSGGSAAGRRWRIPRPERVAADQPCSTTPKGSRTLCSSNLFPSMRLPTPSVSFYKSMSSAYVPEDLRRPWALVIADYKPL